MEKELFETLEILKMFNKKLGSKIISKKEFAEEKENIHELITQKENLNKFLLNIKKSDLQNRELFSSNLIDLHIYYEGFVWQIEEVHELIQKIISNFNSYFPE